LIILISSDDIHVDLVGTSNNQGKKNPPKKKEPIEEK